MPHIEKHEFSIDGLGWAHEEVLIGSQMSTKYRFAIDGESDNSFIIAVLTTPDGKSVDFLDAHLDIVAPNGEQFETGTYPNEERLFLSEQKHLFVLNQPQRGDWTVSAQGGLLPFALNIFVFIGRGPSPPSPPVRCRVCKSMAKALALALVAAATLPSLPAALIAVVAKFLGATIVVAATFISSVVGDVADVIAKKLCKIIGMC
ncbi:MAG: hypothetical protein IIA10_04350 [Proteobacteria bacterium]|nr:hypothetical protein [Pseudomonadota bacterium]